MEKQNIAMNRSDREITNLNQIEEILAKANILRVALCENNLPYVIPVNFGYKEKSIYIHCAKKGKKIDILTRNNNVSFEVDIDTELVGAENACGCSMKYKSVVGFGKAYFILDSKEKKQALDIIMAHYFKGVFEYSLGEIEKTCLIRIDIDSMTGKKSAVGHIYFKH
ncbi:MAG: Pyridoxamine 5'-phosphate oxidase [Candidatus Methanofastidiosum methylothiophilum]|uniref:Pyridoxamine 5'-phosphate oxidase n=1 Tax=Candidatus Methanofastidiosum methylothiophilum TaxID=1705564 RepID=A0A150J0A8_9EURY|nr:MAG: Pyridoxamine 5'-phosphate oxidase [Candidatus Methanofastidiosum methylthiophilus]KYC47484.1 MAG: Pyridoxamine 5'-phosphate oxidase [Candidatus Methanofastidiosum methylthiophilus]KYC50384.1 MAG: Pyridoxamine 5'-phosphate oxidase [Candidatus Methanofastidiosum methylthiophilus]